MKANAQENKGCINNINTNKAIKERKLSIKTEIETAMGNMIFGNAIFFISPSFARSELLV